MDDSPAGLRNNKALWQLLKTSIGKIGYYIRA
jgi:hypothetical protein